MSAQIWSAVATVLATGAGAGIWKAFATMYRVVRSVERITQWLDIRQKQADDFEKRLAALERNRRGR